jgi:CBS domain-containing protein
MQAGELCTRVVATAEPDESVVVAARRMADLQVGDLIVVASGGEALPRPIGIVTDRDLVVQVLADPARSPASTKIGDVMSTALVTAKEDEDVERVVDKMRSHGIRRIPVVDDKGGLQGILALDDVISWMRDQLHSAARVLERQAIGPI